MYAKTFALIGGLAAMANAHIKMSSPVPYGAADLNNSPLDASGSDFPCKQRPSVYEAQGADNTYALGSTGNELAFVGSAVHGGGSCQVSITYDAKPDKNSVWKVIKTFEGGCPAKNAAGNLGDNANAPVPDKYTFDIPKDIPAGKGTIAWTWFNKVGNREMYMNCGPVTLTGDGGSETAYQALPDMFVANIGNDCGTPDSTDVEFPSPGDAVERFNGATDAFAKPTGSCPSGSGGSRPPSGGNGGGSPAPTAPAPTSAPVVSEAPATPTGGGEGGNDGSDKVSAPPLGGIFKPVPTTTSAAPQPTATQPAPEQGNGTSPIEAPVEAPVESPVETPVEAPVEAPTGGSGAEAVGSACDTEGDWNCVGGNSFQRCASGTWSVVMDLSSGTTCKPGHGTNISMVVTRSGRTRPVRFRSA